MFYSVVYFQNHGDIGSNEKTNQPQTLSMKQLCTLVGYSVVKPEGLNLVGCPPML
jgi:hypothetical protein